MYVVRYRNEEGRQRSKTFQSHSKAYRFSNRAEVQLAEATTSTPTGAGRSSATFMSAGRERGPSARPSRSSAERSQAKGSTTLDIYAQALARRVDAGTELLGASWGLTL